MPYAPPTLTSAGLSVPSYADVLADLLAQFQSIYGTNVYLGPDSADYQMISAFAAKISDTMEAFQLVYAAASPLTATGSALDQLVKLNGIARKVASYSTCLLTLTGTAGATIVTGIVRDLNGILWSLPTFTTIATGGTVVAMATCQTAGAITAGASQITQIVNPQAGWISVTNGSTLPVTGQPVESDSALRARQALSVSLPSRTMLAGTQAAIAATAGVSRYNIIENPTGSVTAGAPTWGTPAHSITCVVEGGTDAAVAQAIYNNRGIGALTNGTTTVSVTDSYTGSSLSIGFSRPSYVPIYVALNVYALTGFTTATQGAISLAIATYLNTLQIGQSVVQSELIGAALSVRPNPDAPMFSIRALYLGTSAFPSTSTDIALNYNQVAQGSTGNIIVNLV